MYKLETFVNSPGLLAYCFPSTAISKSRMSGFNISLNQQDTKINPKPFAKPKEHIVTVMRCICVHSLSTVTCKHLG